jgi:hypothetical protein
MQCLKAACGSLLLILASVLAGVLAVQPAQGSGGLGAEAWHLMQVDAGSVPIEIVPDNRADVRDGLPDGRVAVFAGQGDISQAWYAAPTRRYGHAVLGDAIEAGELRVRTAAGSTVSIVLPKSAVFEDRYPRLADLDGDGKVEVITIRASLAKGAAVTVYGLVDGVLRQRATSAFIGRANRWLNIAGIADFTSGGGLQIAYVETPHIGGTLYILAFDAGRLVRVAGMAGFSNHEIGSAEMRLSAVGDVNGDGRPDLILPSADRRSLRMVGVVAGKLVEHARVGLPAAVNRAIATAGRGRELTVTVGLSDGRVFRLRRK